MVQEISFNSLLIFDLLCCLNCSCNLLHYLDKCFIWTKFFFQHCQTNLLIELNYLVSWIVHASQWMNLEAFKVVSHVGLELMSVAGSMLALMKRCCTLIGSKCLLNRYKQFPEILRNALETEQVLNYDNYTLISQSFSYWSCLRPLISFTYTNMQLVWILKCFEDYNFTCMQNDLVFALQVLLFSYNTGGLACCLLNHFSEVNPQFPWRQLSITWHSALAEIEELSRG